MREAKGGETDRTSEGERANCSTRVVPVIADDRT